MSFDLKSITTEKVYRPPRIILTGTEKIGKSKFASNFPDAVFIPIKNEEGIDALKVPKFPVVSSLDELMEAFATLYKGGHGFKTVVIDSVSTLEPQIWEAVCKDSNVKTIDKVGDGFGIGYANAVLKWTKIMEALDCLRNKGMASILIGHVIIKPFNDPLTESYDQYLLDINKKARWALNKWADCLFFANTKTIVKSEDLGFNKISKKALNRKERFLFTQKNPSFPAGCRDPWGKLPEELPLEYPAYEAALKSIIDSEKPKTKEK